MSLASFNIQVKQHIEVLGWGDFGNGIDGVSRKDRVNDRQFRLAHNQIDALDGNYLVFTFDDPTTANALPLEGINGPGDSGSPALVEHQGALFIVGISSAGDYPQREWHSREGKYGWKEYYVNVARVRGWIDKVINSSSVL